MNVLLQKIGTKAHLLELNNEAKGLTGEKLQGQISLGPLYILEIVLSNIIACFGLMQNSAAVIIGAMLIAPLLRPMYGVAFAIVTSRSKLLSKSLHMLIVGVILSVIVSWFFSLLVPTRVETAEILSRVSPNLLDLVIAAASGLVAFLSLKYTRLAEGVAGVAMAAALMPPLSVVGISIGLGNYTHAWGALLLFVTNLVAITGVGCVIFLLYGYRPHLENQKNFIKQITILALSWLIISIPLATTLLNVAQITRIERQSQTVLTDYFNQNNTEAKQLQVRVLNLGRSKISLEVATAVPENTEITNDFIENAQRNLKESLNKDVDVSFSITRSAQVIGTEEITAASKNELIKAQENAVRRVVSNQFPKAKILSISLEKSGDSADSPLLARISLSAPRDSLPNIKDRQAVELSALSILKDSRVVFYWNVLEDKGFVNDPSFEDNHKRFLSDSITGFISQQYDSLVKVDSIDIRWLMTQSDSEEPEQSLRNIEHYYYEIELRINESVDQGEVLESLSKHISLTGDEKPFESNVIVTNFKEIELTNPVTIPESILDPEASVNTNTLIE